jgi:regulator of PEP synthase PpsR (kinase-PPPase family)
MGPLANFLEEELGLKSIQVPGLYRRINNQYFERIDAMEFTVNHDDGINPDKLCKAEIVLIGVSRSGKTPLSIYMSMFGWKVANVPIIKGIEPPEELFKVNPERVFGLRVNINYLISQRYKRIKQLKRPEDDLYVAQSNVRQELQYFDLILKRGKFTQIDITNKPVETSANEIIGIISDRFGTDKHKTKPVDC